MFQHQPAAVVGPFHPRQEGHAEQIRRSARRRASRRPRRHDGDAVDLDAVEPHRRVFADAVGGLASAGVFRRRREECRALAAALSRSATARRRCRRGSRSLRPSTRASTLEWPWPSLLQPDRAVARRTPAVLLPSRRSARGAVAIAIAPRSPGLMKALPISRDSPTPTTAMQNKNADNGRMVRPVFPAVPNHERAQENANAPRPAPALERHGIPRVSTDRSNFNDQVPRGLARRVAGALSGSSGQGWRG